MQRGHREYITYHAADQMVDSGAWDVGFEQKDGTVVLKSRDQGTLHLGDAQHPVWSPVAGGLALNHGSALSMMNRLNVISDWTDGDMLELASASRASCDASSFSHESADSKFNVGRDDGVRV